MQLSLRYRRDGKTQLAVDVLSLWTLLQWGRVLAQLRRGKGCAGREVAATGDQRGLRLFTLWTS